MQAQRGETGKTEKHPLKDVIISHDQNDKTARYRDEQAKDVAVVYHDNFQ